jgi:hypothetical protein
MGYVLALNTSPAFRGGYQTTPITVIKIRHRNYEIEYLMKSKRELRERYEMYWSAFAGQIRTARNDAGHPTSIDPVTADTVHASLLIFPELAGLAGALWNWVTDANDSVLERRKRGIDQSGHTAPLSLNASAA